MLAAAAVLAAVAPVGTAQAHAAGADPLVRMPALAASAPPGARPLGQATPTAPVSLEVVLDPSDPSALSSEIASLYNPGSPSYHHWLTPAQFGTRFGPSPSTVRSVQAWLGSRGLASRRDSEFTVSVSATAAKMTSALGTPFERYQGPGGSQGYVAQGAPLVPASLTGSVRSLLGLESLPAYNSSLGTLAALPQGSASAQGQTCPAPTQPSSGSPQWSLDEMGRAYGIGSLHSAGLTGKGQVVGVYELASHSPQDVSTYESCFGLTNTVTTVPVDGGGGPVTVSGGTAEADLDIEQIATQAPGASILSYEGPNNETGIYDTWNAIVSADAAKVVSTSWGECEADAQLNGEIPAFSTLFQEAAAQGQTILAASGDSGAESCFVSDNSTVAQVSYPASDPYVTAVGGTTLAGAGSETVWNDCQTDESVSCADSNGGQNAGGGGVSRYETMPPWQPHVTTTPPQPSVADVCGNSCREVPDISANAGEPMLVYINGYWGLGVGTSFAAPFMAGLVADRNQGCAGASTGNFAEPLYALASDPSASPYANAFNDITSGNNDMTGTNGGAFSAGPGYDLASGLGSPIATGLTCPDVTSVTPSSAPAGSTVTVNGLALEGATIDFGSKPATVVPSPSDSATSVTVQVPALSGPVQVEATSVLGAGSLSATFSPGSSTPTTSTTSTTSTTLSSPATTTCPAAVGRTLSGAVGIAAVNINGCPGYYVVDAAGQVAAFGSAVFHGDLTGVHLDAPIISMEATPDGGGYWLLGADGGIFTFGDANFYGSTGNIRLNAPVVAMAATADAKGYWLVAKDGGVFTFGDARFYGSTGNIHLFKPVDGIALAPGGNGYWLVASDGGVFTFTTDGFYGSLGAVTLNKPIVGMSSTPDGAGYTLVGSDGGVFNFGDAPFYGSLGGDPPPWPIVGLATAPANNGYYLLGADGSVYTFGPGAKYFGGV